MEYPDLEGKTVLITGANRGIGKGIADRLIKNKCRLVAIYRANIPDLMPLEDSKLSHILINEDINNIPSIAQWLASFEKGNGRIDVLINNAGVDDEGSLFNATPEQWERIMNSNLKAAFFL